MDTNSWLIIQKGKLLNKSPLDGKSEIQWMYEVPYYMKQTIKLTITYIGTSQLRNYF